MFDFKAYRMSTKEDDSLLIYDLYVMNNSGLPVFAGCTVSDYCMAHTDQHPLHTGFIAALLSFGKEVFSGELEHLKFPNIKVNMRSAGEYTIVFVNPVKADDDLIQVKLDEVTTLFKEKYEKQLNEAYVTQKQYDDFVEDAIDLGLIPKDRLQSTKDYFITDQGESEEKSISLLSRFKLKFRRLIKK